MLRYISVLIFSLLAVALQAAVSLGFPGEEAASVGIYVKNIATGNVVAENMPQKALVPASILKSLTAASAMTSLDSEFCFSTDVYLCGKSDAANPSRFDGNLIIESCGDPTIDSSSFSDQPTLYSEIIAGLKSLNIKSITGDIIIRQPMQDQGCNPQWEIDDVGWAYGAGLFGFNYRDNKFRLWPATGKSDPFMPGITVTAAKGDGSSEIFRGIGSSHFDAFGPDPKSPKWVIGAAMPDPAAAFAYGLRQRLKNASIEVGSSQLPISGARTPVCTHTSPLLDDILREMMFESHNLFAEGMLRAIMPGASRKSALEKQQKLWQSRGIATDRNDIIDGSGLSRANRLQPVFLAQVLEYMASNTAYVASFPKVGKDGTVAKFMKETSLAGRLALKSGSMRAVQCYAGYRLDASGKPTHVVVIMVNSFFCQRSVVRAHIEKFLLGLFAK